MKQKLPLLLGLFMSSCVSLDQLPPGSIPSAQAPAKGESPYPALDPGHQIVNSSHFTLYGYSSTELDAVRNIVEEVFTRVSGDIGLYTFLASQNFSVVIYRDREDFLKKTNQPESARVTSAGDKLYLYYDGQNLKPEIAHHLSHMLLKSYLGDKRTTVKWLDEGLAMYEEVAHMSELERSAYNASKSAQLRDKRMAFSQMTFFVTNTEERRRTDAWYQQVESVVSYLLMQGSPLSFAQFISDLRVLEVDQALADAYPAKFRSFTDLEAAWKYTI